MAKAAFQMCRHQGCPALLEKPGYCKDHRKAKTENNRAAFDKLDREKPDWKKRFYSSARWTKCSKSHRKKEPLCRQCKKEGYTVKGDAVHHNLDVDVLVAMGESLYDDKYFETICNNHHLAELRKKKGGKHGKKISYKILETFA